MVAFFLLLFLVCWAFLTLNPLVATVKLMLLSLELLELELQKESLREEIVRLTTEIDMKKAAMEKRKRSGIGFGPKEK